MMAFATSPPFISIFSRRFDVAVYGAGCLGVSCVTGLAEAGLNVLLVESSGDLLWEASRALENVGGRLDGDSSRAQEFPLFAASGDDFHFEPAMAEIAAASRLLHGEPRISTLLYAFPVEAELSGNRITKVTVATKDGRRSIEAERWVDASETGVLARLAGASADERQPIARYRNIIVQSPDPASIDAACATLAGEYPGVECLSSVKSTERRLRFPVGDTPWYRQVIAITKTLRKILTEMGGANFIVSHCGLQDYPVYLAREIEKERESREPENLTILSPALRADPSVSLSDRVDFGGGQAKAVAAMTRDEPSIDVSIKGKALRQLRRKSLIFEVVVVGTGTAGAIAALASAQQGAKTLAVDLASFPGGVGTGGGINGYFHGASGGLQERIDLQVNAITKLFLGKDGVPNRWHHDAKMIVLLEEFAEKGVEFLGNALLSGIVRDTRGRVTEIQVVAGGQQISLRADAFIDATGDGDLCALAGAQFRSGRQGDERTLAFSQVAFALAENGDSLSVKSLNFDSGWVDPSDPEDLTRSRLSGISQYEGAREETRAAILMMAPILGLRQSRQIETDFTLTLTELIEHARCSDAIGHVETVADTHSVDYEFEDDDLAFYFWTCRGFRNPLSCELPYGILLPRGLRNVWIACRACGVDISASYGIRMQRDMQRIGEAAGTAAAFASRSKSDARDVDMAALRRALSRSGARRDAALLHTPPASETLLSSLDVGKPGIHLWHLQRNWPRDAVAVKQRLTSTNENVSFHAAAICAMALDSEGNGRLLKAIETRETGLTPEQARVTGAHGQCIDIPFWLQALFLLRRTGDRECLDGLVALARENELPFNVATILATTLEHLARRAGDDPRITEIFRCLRDTKVTKAILPPSRSLWRELHGEPYKPLHNDQGVDTRENHIWQMHLVLDRIRRILNCDSLPVSNSYVSDPRGYVRRAFSPEVKSN